MIELTIRVPDELFERIRRDAAARHAAPEQLAVDTLQVAFAPFVEPVPTDVVSTVARLSAWVAQQPPVAVRPPLAVDAHEREELDRDLENLFASIQQRTEAVPYTQIQHDVAEALKDA